MCLGHLQNLLHDRKHGFLPSLHCGFTAPDAVAYKSVGDFVQAQKLVKLSRAPIVFGRLKDFARCCQETAVIKWKQRTEDCHTCENDSELTAFREFFVCAEIVNVFIAIGAQTDKTDAKQG